MWYLGYTYFAHEKWQFCLSPLIRNVVEALYEDTKVREGGFLVSYWSLRYNIYLARKVVIVEVFSREKKKKKDWSVYMLLPHDSTPSLTTST